MLFCVMVPVLSLHNTVAEPKVSMALGVRVRMLFFVRRQAPSAMKMVNTTGNSSGKRAIAAANPFNKASKKFPRVI